MRERGLALIAGRSSEFVKQPQQIPNVLAVRVTTERGHLVNCQDHFDRAAQLERTAKGFPTLAALRGSSAGIEARFVEPLLADPSFARAAVQTLLDEHFEPSLHDDVLTRAGFPPDWLAGVPSAKRRTTTSLERDPAFRDAVLAAYDHRCAVTGFQAMIDGALFGVEAAHVHWHSKGGPSHVTNGIALNPTMHKLFDYGAWTLTDDRRVLVSSVFSGSDVTIEMLRSQHGKPLRQTVRGEQAVDVACIRWHREAGLGGVFRGPALG